MMSDVPLVAKFTAVDADSLGAARNHGALDALCLILAVLPLAFARFPAKVSDGCHGFALWFIFKSGQCRCAFQLKKNVSWNLACLTAFWKLGATKKQ